MNTARSPELVAKSIVDIVTTLKGNSRDVSVSNIIVRSDNSNLDNSKLDKSLKKDQIKSSKSKYVTP